MSARSKDFCPTSNAIPTPNPLAGYRAPKAIKGLYCQSFTLEFQRNSPTPFQRKMAELAVRRGNPYAVRL
jgi:hypothetical protein